MNGTTPVPVRVTSWGLPLALSVILSVPVLAPTAVGVNVTLIVQLAPAASALPQLLVWSKSPLIAIAAIFSVALPALLSVTVSGALVLPTSCLAKLRLASDRVASGPLKNAVPVRLTFCGLPGELSVRVIAPILVPAALGANLTLIVQSPPTARLLGHVSVTV